MRQAAQAERYELVVAGGKGGKTLAMEMARAGRRAAMVEHVPEMIGGTCINRSCIPTKTVIRSAEVGELVRRAPEFGMDATLGDIAATAVRARKDAGRARDARDEPGSSSARAVWTSCSARPASSRRGGSRSRGRRAPGCSRESRS